jgi:hypothetical protein
MKFGVALLPLLLLFLVSSVSASTAVYGNTNYYLSVPDNNFFLNFDETTTFSVFCPVNSSNMLFFAFPEGYYLYFGGSNCNVTVASVSSTRLEYDVSNLGSQLINIGKAPRSVTLDGILNVAGGGGYSYNSETYAITVTGASENAVIVFSSESSDSRLPGGDIDTSFRSPLFQYILAGDFLGFVLACYTTTVGSVFYAVCIFFVSAVIYIRQKSLFIVSLIWLFIGGSYITLFWEFSAVAVWFTILGIAGIFVELILVWRRGV